MVLAAGDDAAGRRGRRPRPALQVSRAGRHIGQEAIQLHGGIAMTAEYSVGSYTSHLTALDHLLGDGQLPPGPRWPPTSATTTRSTRCADRPQVARSRRPLARTIGRATAAASASREPMTRTCSLARVTAV